MAIVRRRNQAPGLCSWEDGGAHHDLGVEFLPSDLKRSQRGRSRMRSWRVGGPIQFQPIKLKLLATDS